MAVAVEGGAAAATFFGRPGALRANTTPRAGRERTHPRSSLSRVLWELYSNTTRQRKRNEETVRGSHLRACGGPGARAATRARGLGYRLRTVGCWRSPPCWWFIAFSQANRDQSSKQPSAPNLLVRSAPESAAASVARLPRSPCRRCSTLRPQKMRLTQRTRRRGTDERA